MSKGRTATTETSDRSAATRQAILDSATHVFADRGFRGASLREIAAGAGLKSHTHIYWYFADKSALLIAVLRGSVESARIPDLEELRALPIRDALERVAHAYLRAFESPQSQELFRILLAESARDPAVQEEFGKAAPTTTVNVLTELLALHSANGALDVPNPRAQATIVWGQLIAFVAIRDIAPHLAGALPGIEGYVDTIVGTLLDGLRPR
ncbi:MAG: TetR/AcrR family transcriptional regulator [Myxococcota bacterium]